MKWQALLFGPMLFVIGTLADQTRAADCPKDVKACKVIIVTPEQADSMKKLIENTAITGPYNQIKAAVEFYVGIIDKAADGTPVDPPKPAPVAEPKK